MTAALAERLNVEPKIEPEALPCPFCGSAVTIEPWHGGAPTKVMLCCIHRSDQCEVGPMVTGETRDEALMRWNRRATDDGFAYLCPDTGMEWSEQHPIKSGEVSDAERVKRMTLGEFRSRYPVEL